MPENLNALILDLVEWVNKSPRQYDDVMNAWRTSCPGLPVWESAVENGFVAREWKKGEGAFVSITPQGRIFLQQHQRL
ncbi:MAG: hypothetical protein ACR2OJ_06060 [Hyphomicrobiales bacterium]